VVLVTDAAAAAASTGRSGGAKPPSAAHTLTRAEVAIAAAAVAEGRCLIFVANKVDLLDTSGVDKSAEGVDTAAAAAAAAALARDVAARVPDAAGAPCVALSAETGAGVDALMPAVAAVHAAWTRRVPTSRLNSWMADTVRDLEAGAGGRGACGSPAAKDVRRVRYVTQPSVRPPGFVAFVRGGADLAPATRRLLTKRLRAAFGFEGVPLRLHVRAPAGSGRRQGRRLGR
jgi:GTP-binding protein